MDQNSLQNPGQFSVQNNTDGPRQSFVQLDGRSGRRILFKAHIPVDPHIQERVRSFSFRARQFSHGVSLFLPKRLNPAARIEAAWNLCGYRPIEGVVVQGVQEFD